MSLYRTGKLGQKGRVNRQGTPITPGKAFFSRVHLRLGYGGRRRRNERNPDKDYGTEMWQILE